MKYPIREFLFEYQMPNGDDFISFKLTQEDLNQIDRALEFLRESPDWTSVRLELVHIKVGIKILANREEKNENE